MVTDTASLTDALRHVRGLVVGDANTVARQGYKACMKGTPIVVPGKLNLTGTLTSRALPKWLVRRLSGLMGRSIL
jgi:short-subunit dehydrogenase